MSDVVGLLLAAGAGRRMGVPKALLRDQHEVPFLRRAVGLLHAGGCDRVVVVLGAAADQARSLLDADVDADAARTAAGASGQPTVEVVVALDWAEGMGASLRCGLAAVAAGDAQAALVSLVDLPDLDTAVLRRVLDEGASRGRAALVRATYTGRPGHPVLVGRDHWGPVAATAVGDAGAREYLEANGVVACECGDLATGRDVDRPEDLPQR